jgi:hypothetical protein
MKVRIVKLLSHAITGFCDAKGLYYNGAGLFTLLARWPSPAVDPIA